MAIVIETLGTGHTVPFDPPTPLARYYALLVEEFQFTGTWFRTDYEFPSMADGERLVRFFFGEQRAGLFAEGRTRILPECTSPVRDFTLDGRRPRLSLVRRRLLPPRFVLTSG
jgi:hypothetical protein